MITNRQLKSWLNRRRCMPVHSGGCCIQSCVPQLRSLVLHRLPHRIGQSKSRNGDQALVREVPHAKQVVLRRKVDRPFTNKRRVCPLINFSRDQGPIVHRVLRMPIRRCEVKVIRKQIKIGSNNKEILSVSLRRCSIRSRS